MRKACVIRVTGGDCEPDIAVTWHESVEEARRVCRAEWNEHIGRYGTWGANVIDEGEGKELSCWAYIHAWFVEIVPQ